jgi:dynein heavy chain
VSTENGAILTNSERTTLMIDPQLQGIVWIKKTYDKELKVTRLSMKNLVKTVEFAVEAGDPVLIEYMGNSVDAVIQPVYARQIIKKGKSRIIKMGDNELNLSPEFKMFMHSKLANPHYPPEIQAECTIINFTVTENGLEDQLLSLVVRKERPDLAATKEHLVQQQNEFKITLSDLEKGLLKQLQEAEGDLTENIELIDSLEKSKTLSTEIKEKVEIAKATEVDINVSSEHYRPAANRGALVFFLMNELNKIHAYYKFSLDSFLIVVTRAIDLVAKADREAKLKAKKEEEGEDDAEEGEEGEGEKKAAPVEEEAAPEEIGEMTPRTLQKRVNDLIESITYCGFNFTRRGSLEDDKLIISTMLTFKILIRKGLIV